jgi:hypothetical protein
MATGPSYLCYRESNWRKDGMGTVKYASRVVAPKTVHIPVLSGILSSPLRHQISANPMIQRTKYLESMS